jgi:hypothetical protein
MRRISGTGSETAQPKARVRYGLSCFFLALPRPMRNVKLDAGLLLQVADDAECVT